MKHLRKSISGIVLFSFLVLSSCGNDRNGEVIKNDTVKENPLVAGLSDTAKAQFRQLIASMPIPFEVLNKVSGSPLVCKPEILLPVERMSQFSTAEAQAANIGVYGADMAYLIAFEKLGESGAYLKNIRVLADAVVIPTAFDAGALQRYEVNKNNQDSLQMLMLSSYGRIDSTLQSNERFALAALVVSGCWIESIYLTTTQLNSEAKNENNKLLYEILSDEQSHMDRMISLAGMFPNDSLFAELNTDLAELKKLSSPVNEYTPDELSLFTKQVALIREKLINLH